MGQHGDTGSKDHHCSEQESHDTLPEMLQSMLSIKLDLDISTVLHGKETDGRCWTEQVTYRARGSRRSQNLHTTQ